MADFGVLHRNELSGVLTGMTRVRRFCQDDAHIFCRCDQLADEVHSSLKFMKHVYDVFGMTFQLELSTKPAKALGDDALWDEAEVALATALDSFSGKGKWRINPGDGAFYGPKIDIKVFDAMERIHQCATIQLDFQLPIRFDLKYVAKDEAGKVEEEHVTSSRNKENHVEQCQRQGEQQDGPSKFDRPVMIHRALLGSVERMIAVLIEHYGGSWPFWISPRQAMVVPIAKVYNEYATSVRDRLHEAGFFCDAELSNKTLNKKIREAQMEKYSFILVVGESEQERNEVNIRGKGQYSVDNLIQYFKELTHDKK